jgi:hypothetical protein
VRAFRELLRRSTTQSPQQINRNLLTHFNSGSGQINATGDQHVVAGVNANAKAQGLSSPAIGYWSPEGHCFVIPA